LLTKAVSSCGLEISPAGTEADSDAVLGKPFAGVVAVGVIPESELASVLDERWGVVEVTFKGSAEDGMMKGRGEVASAFAGPHLLS
jgi:hypothetical protein